MSQRLTIDASIIGYWGLDEALETDNAIDATANVLDLTVTASSGTAPGRVGNSRRFNGSSSVAALTSAALRLTGDLTLMAWVKLSSFNSSGSLLRAFVSCGGPTTGDNTLYSLQVSNTGVLSYRHTSASGEVIVATAASTIRTGQFYFVVVRRVANGGNQDVEIFVDNVQMALPTITVGGTPQAMPVPPPAANASAVFSLGRSQRQTDTAFWDGFLDEVSVHNVARPYHAYLIDSYYRAAIRSATTKLSATDTVVAVSSYEMGAGVRWWCFERDRDLYVVRESPFGSFGAETRLTTVGGGGASNAGAPELIYDATSDTLYVFFVAGNRIFKLTATSTDDPATINMPFTSDTGSIIKSLDHADGGRLGLGGAGQREVLPSEMVQGTFPPIKVLTLDLEGYGLAAGGDGRDAVVTMGAPNAVNLIFMTVPTLGFGLVMGPVDSQMSGYVAYKYSGGVPVALTTPVAFDIDRYFVAISPRVYGQVYFVEALNPKGYPSGVFSNAIVDRFNEADNSPNGNVVIGQNDGLADNGPLGGGGAGQREPLPEELVYVNRAPLKMSLQDPDTSDLGLGGGGQSGSITNGSTNRPTDAGRVEQI